MLRKHLKNTHKHEKIKQFLEKYKVPKEYISTTRKMIGRGAFIGLFMAMIPMPFQMLAVLAVAPFYRFNVAVALVMCWVTNPLTMPFVYYIEYITGSFFLGIEPGNVQLTVDWFQNHFQDIVFPLYLGALFYAFVISFIVYYVITHFWIKSVYKDRIKSRSLFTKDKTGEQ
jgi:uncharacterized protein (DUF2062 family)